MGSKALKGQRVMGIAKSTSALAPSAMAYTGMQAIIEGLKMVADSMSNDMPADAVADVFNTLDKTIGKAVEAQREAARNALLDMASQAGTVVEGKVGKFNLKSVVRRSKLPPEEKLRGKLDEVGRPESALFDKVVSMEVSEAKLAKLKEEGVFDEEWLDANRKLISTALVVEKL